jgi:hypothetical protein
MIIRGIAVNRSNRSIARIAGGGYSTTCGVNGVACPSGREAIGPNNKARECRCALWQAIRALTAAMARNARLGLSGCTFG